MLLPVKFFWVNTDTLIRLEAFIPAYFFIMLSSLFIKIVKCPEQYTIKDKIQNIFRRRN